MSVNQEVIELLTKVSSVLKVKEGDTFRFRAYQNAITSIENLNQSLAEIDKQDKLKEVDGVGESLSGYIQEYLKHKKVKHFEKILKSVPQGMYPLLKFRGIGPITAYKLAKYLSLKKESTAVSELRKHIQSNNLASIPHFKQKTIEKITNIFKDYKKVSQRISLAEALDVCDPLVKYLKENPQIVVAEGLGSIRRKVATIGDIDIGFASHSPKEAMAYALKYPLITKTLISGEHISRVRLINGFEVDLKICNPNSWGSLLQHYTGSKLHNIHLRKHSLELGYSLSEYGIKSKNKSFEFEDEKDFYNFLGLKYIPPEIREDRGEIEASQDNLIPNLIDLKDIKGDFHVHSNFEYPSSHDYGTSSVAEIVAKASDLGYQYLGLSDHNPKQKDLSEKEHHQILVQRKKYLENQGNENSVKNRGIKLFIGLEVDIKKDGTLATSNESLGLVDYAIVSIHSSFDLSESENTTRIIKALSNPKAIILGHPTARIINSRDPIQADWQRIAEFCSQNNKFIEINASPLRSDIPEDIIYSLLETKVKFIINTDSHESNSLDLMKYGVWQARRGWVTKNQVINTKNLSDLIRVLKLP